MADVAVVIGEIDPIEEIVRTTKGTVAPTVETETEVRALTDLLATATEPVGRATLRSRRRPKLTTLMTFRR